MLLTAIAATVVIVSAVADATHGRSVQEAPPVRDPELTEQPLIGLRGGVTVREVTQDAPFSLIALTGDLAGTSTRVRAKRPDGSWGPWYQTELETAAPDAGPAGGASGRPAGSREGPRSTAPVCVGTTRPARIAVTRPIDAPVTVGAPAASLPADKDGLGYRPASR